MSELKNEIEKYVKIRTRIDSGDSTPESRAEERAAYRRLVAAATEEKSQILEAELINEGS